MKKILLLISFCCLFSLARAQTTDTSKKPPLPAKGLDPDGVTVANDKIFSVVGHMPQFPGATDSLHRYLTSHIVYPPDLLKNRKGGAVVVSFVVEQDGSLTNFRPDRKIDTSFSTEIIRIMQPVKYIPGTQNGAPVRVAGSIKVYFDPDHPGFY